MEELKKCLDILLLNRNVRLDRFDADYLDDFHYIMRENYNINSCEKNSNDVFDKIIEILNKYFNGNIIDNTPLEKVSKILKDCILNKSDYKPKYSSNEECREHKYHTTNNWEILKNKKDVKSMLTIQKNYSLQSGGTHSAGPNSHFNARFRNQKHELFNNLNPNSKVLSIGNRWKDEIIYIRNQFKLPNTIGLDLFTTDENYVKIGDIHEAPFNDNTFDVVYQKNTFNKLYDLRKALDECVRILKPGGLLVSDDCLDYTIGVNPLARTNVTTNKWYFSYLKNNIDRIIVDIEEKVNFSWLANTGLFAIKIKN